MWGGRFQSQSSDLFKAFNDSLPVDYLLAEQDIQGSLAWADALNSVGVLNDFELQQLKNALHQILDDVKRYPQIILESKAEDIHSWVEQMLIKRVGDLGKKLHTGRSRNDQVLTDLKLWCKKEVKKLLRELKKTILLLNDKAAFFSEAIMPSYTHLQRAQPITFGFWLNAGSNMLLRDVKRLEVLADLSDECPLGASAVAGTAFEIDRDQLAVHLGFSQATHNALDTVSDRDFVLDLLYGSSVSMLHLSRLSEDLIFYNTQEASFIVLDDTVTSGSSLMPQKKNPDALELIRGKCAETYALLSQMMMALKALPLGYNKDLQQDKSVLFQSMRVWFDCLQMFQQVIHSLQINKTSMQKAVDNSFANATELADYLVEKGVPFRDAHEQTGRLVVAAESEGKFLRHLSLLQFQKVNPSIEKNIYQWLDSDSAIARRRVKGGVGNYVQLAKQMLEYRLVDAALADVESIYGIISHWAKKGENLPRSYEEIINQLASFKLIKNSQNQILGCGNMHIYDEHLVELRSVSIHPDHQGKGLGKRLVFALLAASKQLNLSKAFVLTRQPAFFKSCDFEMSVIDDLPKKVLKDCQYCPKKSACDEVAMIYEL